MTASEDLGRDGVLELVALMAPRVALVTGAGTGEIARVILERLPAGAELRVYETDEELRRVLIGTIESKSSTVIVGARPASFEGVDLAFLGSELEQQTIELEQFTNWASPGSVVIVRDWRAVQRATIKPPGFTLPAGGWLGRLE